MREESISTSRRSGPLETVEASWALVALRLLLQIGQVGVCASGARVLCGRLSAGRAVVTCSAWHWGFLVTSCTNLK